MLFFSEAKKQSIPANTLQSVSRTLFPQTLAITRPTSCPPILSQPDLLGLQVATSSRRPTPSRASHICAPRKHRAGRRDLERSSVQSHVVGRPVHAWRKGGEFHDFFFVNSIKIFACGWVDTFLGTLEPVFHTIPPGHCGKSHTTSLLTSL